jgi:hypothetical protein
MPNYETQFNLSLLSLSVHTCILSLLLDFVSGQERSGTPDSISSIGSATNQKHNIQPSPTPSNPVSHPSAFVSPQPAQSLPQRSTPQQHPGQPSFNQQPMGYQGQQPGYGQQAPGRISKECTDSL